MEPVSFSLHNFQKKKKKISRKKKRKNQCCSAGIQYGASGCTAAHNQLPGRATVSLPFTSQLLYCTILHCIYMALLHCHTKHSAPNQLTGKNYMLLNFTTQLHYTTLQSAQCRQSTWWKSYWRVTRFYCTTLHYTFTHYRLHSAHNQVGGRNGYRSQGICLSCHTLSSCLAWYTVHQMVFLIVQFWALSFMWYQSPQKISFIDEANTNTALLAKNLCCVDLVNRLDIRDGYYRNFHIRNKWPSLLLLHPLLLLIVNRLYQFTLNIGGLGRLGTWVRSDMHKL